MEQKISSIFKLFLLIFLYQSINGFLASGIEPDPLKTPCGLRTPGGAGLRMLNSGETSAQGEFPWIMAILKRSQKVTPISEIKEDSFKFEFKCGGSLIAPSVVITVAHCVETINSGNSIQDYMLVAGEFDRDTDYEPLASLERLVSKAILHPRYNKNNFVNDIAILFAKEPFELSIHIQPICLPPKGTNFDRQDECLAVGWGRDKYGNDVNFQSQLRSVGLPIIPNDECQQRYTNGGVLFKIDQSHICAGGIPGKDTCQGDGGSPLMCKIPNENNLYYLSGIVAFGVECGTTIPGGYTNVPHLRDWIDEILRQNSVNSSYYTL